jgi:hypothetical protein
MTDACIYMATELYDPVSMMIREKTNCDWSHAGLFLQSTQMTLSAMCDGNGVAWRTIKPTQKILLLDHVGCDLALEKMKTQLGKPYNLLDIVGIEVGKNWSTAGRWICDVLTFWSFRETGNPLINHQFIPDVHLTPRDILLAKGLTIIKQFGPERDF